MNWSMSIRFFQHRETYYVEIDGKKRSLHTKDKAEGLREFRKIKKHYLAGKLAHLSGECSKTLKDFSEEYLEWAKKTKPHSTYRADKLALDKLKYYAGETILLDRIGIKHIDIMVADLRKLSPESVNNYIRHSRVVLKKAKEWGYVQVNPLKDVKEIKTEKRPPAFLDRKQASEFITSIKDVDLRRLVVAYLTTGRRRSELLNIEWKDVDLESEKYFVRKAKNHLSKWYPIDPMFKAVLLSLPRGSGRVFDKFSHPDTLSHYVKSALVQSGNGELHLHHLRHSFASMKVMEGKSLFEVGQLLGHKDIKATQIYSHLSDDHLRDIAGINLGPVDLQGD